MAFVTFNDPSSPSMFEVRSGSSGGGITIQLPSTISIGGGGTQQPLPPRPQPIPSGQPALTGGLTLLLIGLLFLLVLPKRLA